MNARPRCFGLALAAVLVTQGGPRQSYADANAESLKAITDTADKICGVVAAAGESQSAKVTGDVKAQLSGLAKRLADLGITGTGTFETDSYAGVVRSDLPTALSSQMDCKLKVFDTLQSKLLIDTRPTRGR
jgi:hypothetical protein